MGVIVFIVAVVWFLGIIPLVILSARLRLADMVGVDAVIMACVLWPIVAFILPLIIFIGFLQWMYDAMKDSKQ